MSTYGTRDATQFRLPSVESDETYYTLVDADTGKITLKRISPLSFTESLDATVGTIEVSGPNAGKFVPNSAGATPTEIKAFAQQPQAIQTVKDKAIETTTKAKIKSGVDPKTAQTESNKLIKPNSATDPGAQNPTRGETAVSDADQKAFKAFDEEKGTFKEGTREEYDNVKYPLNLSSAHQDCIKFSILKYRPSLEYSNQNSQGDVSRLVTIENGNPKIGKEILGTITLPIPAGINDSNSVDWQSDTINEIQSTFGTIATEAIRRGRAGAEDAAEKANFSAKLSDPTTTKGISGMLAGIAVGSQKLQQRSTGTIFNNNLELLFISPSLRSFSFTFKLSPREPQEAKEIMKIIRFFKQAMSVKRSKSTLLLKTPHTFAISYLTSNKQHPYLNKFKECALTTFNVDYTPEGQYMTYMSSDIQDRSMISYVISMTFQELEPIFDDEYQKENPVSNIGY